ncbi:MAG: acetyltransferase [Frankiales bacterium]|nr:acetyltransferase [Frankiales bacterium]
MHVRTATSEDALAVETVRTRGWQAAYRGIVSDGYLDAMVVDSERRAGLIGQDGVTTLVAEEDEVLGMAVYGPSRHGEGTELYALYVDPAHWRAGVGTALLAACNGLTELWVLQDNTGAQAFYEQHGFRADGGSQVLEIDGPVTEIRMRRG